MTVWTRHRGDRYGDHLLDELGRHDRPLNAVVEFDCPFRVWEDDESDVTRVEDNVPGVYAPDVADVDGITTTEAAWSPLTGYTRQHGYRGAVLHPSEQLAGDLARDVLSSPGIYAVVEVRDENDEYPADPIGWAILRYNEQE